MLLILETQYEILEALIKMHSFFSQLTQLISLMLKYIFTHAVYQ